MEWASDIKNFSQEQLPLLANEIIRFAFWENLIFIILLIPAVIGCYWGCKAFCPRADVDGMREAPLGHIIGGTCVLMLTLGCIIRALIGVSELIQVSIAPRMYILEYVCALGGKSK